MQMSKKERLAARNTLIIHWQENEYEKKMNDGLSKISDLQKQLEWLNKFELEYKDEVQRIPYLADASGACIVGNPHKAGFDAMIQNRRDFIMQEIKDSKKPIRNKQKKEVKSLKYQHPENLNSLYKQLVSKKYIDSNTTLDQFNAAFTEQPKEVIKPIQWLKETNLLAYFLDELFKNQKYQSIVEACQIFKSKQGRLITKSSLSSAKNQTKVKPKDSDKLDKILISLEKH